MGYVIFVVIAGAMALSLWDGKFVEFGGLVDRRREPRLYWAGMTFFGVVALASLWLQLTGKW